jgi:hypothetical protein
MKQKMKLQEETEEVTKRWLDKTDYLNGIEDAYTRETIAVLLENQLRYDG